MKISIEAKYTTNTTTPIDIHVNSWDEVESWYLKWDTLFYKVKGETEMREVCLQSDFIEGMDAKHPVSVDILPADDEGFADYSTILDSRE